MKQTSFYAIAGLLLGLTSVASANSITSPIQIARSSYGIALSGGSACDVLCVVPSDVTVLEQNYVFSGGGGEVYDFDISSLPTDTTGFTLTLTGSTPFLDVSKDKGHDFGAFVCKQLPAKTGTQCGPKLPAGVTTTTTTTATIIAGKKKNSGKKQSGVSSVTFTVNGDHENLVFYAIESGDAPNTVTADLEIHTNASNNLQAPRFLIATPEPQFGSMLLGFLLLSAVSIHRWRTRMRLL